MRVQPCLELAVFSLAASGFIFSQTPNAQPANNPPKAARPVKYQPYTVELKTTTVQTLANGATITRETTEIHAIDSQFRTYHYETHPVFNANQKAFATVYINDPVEGIEIRWNSQKDEATVLKMLPMDQRHGCWRSDSGGTQFHFGEARPVPVHGPGVTGFSRGAATLSSPGAAADRSTAIASVGFGGGTGTVSGVAIPALAHTTPHVEDLGTATIEGIEVQGRRLTYTIPTGEIGNDQPLTSVSETWSAPSLGIALRSTHDDPQSGKSSTEVVRLDLSEPPLSTFQPPEGYKVVTEEMHQVPCQSPGQQ